MKHKENGHIISSEHWGVLPQHMQRDYEKTQQEATHEVVVEGEDNSIFSVLALEAAAEIALSPIATGTESEPAAETLSQETPAQDFGGFGGGDAGGGGAGGSDL